MSRRGSRSMFENSDDEDDFFSISRSRRSLAPSPEESRRSHRSSTGISGRATLGSGSDSDRRRSLISEARSHSGSDRRRSSARQSEGIPTPSSFWSRGPRTDPRETGRYAAERARRSTPGRETEGWRSFENPRYRGHFEPIHGRGYPDERESRRSGSRSSGRLGRNPYRDSGRRTERSGSSPRRMSDLFARRSSRATRPRAEYRRSDIWGICRRWDDDARSDDEW